MKNYHIALDVNQKEGTTVFNNIKQIYIAYKSPQQLKPSVKFVPTSNTGQVPFKVDQVASNGSFVGFRIKTQSNYTGEIEYTITYR